MTTALKFSKLNKFLSLNEFKIITNHVKKFGLPNDIKKYFSINDVNKIISFMIHDKKNYTDKINLILLKKIGIPMIDNKFDKKRLKMFLSKELSN